MSRQGRFWSAVAFGLDVGLAAASPAAEVTASLTAIAGESVFVRP